MPRYAVTGQDTNDANTTLLYVVNGATAPSRIKLFELIVSSDATPADASAEYQIKRITAENGTPGGSAVTPVPLDFNDRAANSNAVFGPTGEPTYATGVYLMIALNQRATWRWVAMEGRELVCDNADDNGFGLFVNGTPSATGNTNATMHYEE